jgi:hypothetical protein
MLPKCVYRNAVEQQAWRGVDRLGSARYGENTAFLIVALRLFGREVFNGKLPSIPMTIHVTNMICDFCILGTVCDMFANIAPICMFN